MGPQSSLGWGFTIGGDHVCTKEVSASDMSEELHESRWVEWSERRESRESHSQRANLLNVTIHCLEKKKNKEKCYTHQNPTMVRSNPDSFSILAPSSSCSCTLLTTFQKKFT